ncbi:unnamed protein product, partial [Scytosiphon promiscuus]
MSRIRLEERFHRLEKGDELTRVCGDKCCDGFANRARHLVTHVFKNVMEAPFADRFHHTQRATTSTNTSHPLQAQWSRDWGQVFAPKHLPDEY